MHCGPRADGSQLVVSQVAGRPDAQVGAGAVSVACASAPQPRRLRRIDCDHVHPTPGSWTLARASSGRGVARRPFQRPLRPGSPILPGPGRAAGAGELCGSYGEDGTIFGLPDTSVQLEIVRSTEPVVRADRIDALVFYLPDAATQERLITRTAAAGVEPTSRTPTWHANSGMIYQDPDGRSSTPRTEVALQPTPQEQAGRVARAVAGSVVADGLGRPRSSPWGNRDSTRTAGASSRVGAAAVDVDPHPA